MIRKSFLLVGRKQVDCGSQVPTTLLTIHTSVRAIFYGEILSFKLWIIHGIRRSIVLHRFSLQSMQCT